MAACVKFGCKIDPTPEEEASIQSLIHLQQVHGVFVNDYFSWPKEAKAYEESGGKIPIRNAVDLQMRWSGMNAEEAQLAIKRKCWQINEEYAFLKKEHFRLHKDTITPTTRRWLALYELMEAGNITWSMTSWRHNSPGGHGYRAYYEKRCREGAVFSEYCDKGN